LLVASDGAIFAFGDAAFEESTGGQHLNKPVVGIAPDGTTRDYWLVATDGGILAFNASFLGSVGGVTLDQPVNGVAPTPDNLGYWLVASDGSIFRLQCTILQADGWARSRRANSGHGYEPH
jgi:hypothetical protein